MTLTTRNTPLPPLHVACDGRHLASLVVENLTTGERAEFTVNRWFAKGREDGAIERELTPTAHYLPPGMADAGVGGSCHYSVAIRTQPAQGGLLPDDSEVLVNIIGLGDQATGLHSLALGGTGIAAGALEIFDLEGLPDVGPIRQLDMFATIPNWGVESVEVVNETTGMRAVFLPDGPLQRGNAPIYAAEYVDAPGWAGAAQQQQYGMMTQQFDGSATVERVMGGKSGAPGYTVVFHTSNICWAGTKAKVYFELIGDTGSSGMVFPSTGAGQFERGVSSSGSYARLPFLGDIRQVIVGTDGDGFGAAWHLRQVEVIHSASGMRYLFDCNRWIDKGCAWRRVLQARR